MGTDPRSLTEHNYDDDDVSIVMSETGCSEDQSLQALQQNDGNVVDAILSLCQNTGPVIINLDDLSAKMEPQCESVIITFHSEV